MPKPLEKRFKAPPVEVRNAPTYVVSSPACETRRIAAWEPPVFWMSEPALATEEVKPRTDWTEPRRSKVAP